MSALMTTDSSSGVILDSLPYVETVHEDYEEYALALIEEEMKAIAPRPLKKMTPLNFRTPTMKTEYNTLVVQDGENSHVRPRPKEQLQIFQPTKITKPTEWKDQDKASNDALSRIKSRYEAERIRGMVLQVEKEEGVASWKDYTASLDELAAHWTKLVQQEVEAVEEINFRRQQAQTQQVGPELDRLTQEYQKTLYKRNQLEHAIEGLRRKNGANSGGDESRKRKADESSA